MSRRRQALLGELFERSNEKLGAYQDEPKVLSLSKYDGLVPADEYFGKRIASTRLDGYKRVDSGGWAYSTIHIDEGSIARNELGFGGVISPMYTTMSWVSARDDPRYVAMLLTQPSMLAAYRALARGTVNRRRSLPWTAFASIPVELPPLYIQRRIVDLVGALDANIAALENEREQCLALLDASLDLGFSTPDALFRAVGELVSARSGPSWSAQDETDEPREGALPVIKITNTRPDGSFDHRQLAFVQSLPTSTTTLSESSIVVIRTNGNRDRIGNVYIPPAAVYGSAVSAFQFHLEMLDPTDRDFLYWFLRSPTTQRAMSAAASGTTGLGNLALRTLRTLPVPWPDKAARDVLCSRYRAIAAVIKGLAEECESLRRLRAALLPALLSGDVEIPESYDELVGVA